MKTNLFFYFVFLLLLFSCNTNNNWLNKDLGHSIYRDERIKDVTNVNPTQRDYGGGRGANHLIVYTPEFGEYTETNKWGTEAIINNGIVTFIGENNSKIPNDGFVVSGNQSASIWINKNLDIGMEVTLTNDYKLKYARTENSNIEKARRIFIDASNRLAEKQKITDDYSEILKESEEKINQYFKLFLDAKANNNIAKANKQAEQILEVSKNLYYKSYTPKKDDFKGVWIRLSDETPEDLVNTIQHMADAGINAILPETIYNGFTIYPNGNNLMPQLPKFKGWDPMEVMIKECAKYNIQVIPWTEMFFIGGENSPLVKDKSECLGLFRHGSHAAELEEGFHYFCPSRPEVHEFLLETLDTLASRYDIDGIQLDYIRYSLSKPWEKGLCYCDYCKEKIKEEYNFNIYDITPQDSIKWQTWNQYRANNITRFVKSVSDHFKEKHPDIPLSADVFPDNQLSLEEKFQDWKLWIEKGYLDDVYIMSYSTMNDAVKSDVDVLMSSVKGTDVSPIVGLGPYMGFHPELLLQQIEIAQEAGADGVCLFSYHSLNDEQMKALKCGPFGELNKK